MPAEGGRQSPCHNVVCFPYAHLDFIILSRGCRRWTESMNERETRHIPHRARFTIGAAGPGNPMCAKRGHFIFFAWCEWACAASIFVKPHQHGIVPERKVRARSTLTLYGSLRVHLATEQRLAANAYIMLWKHLSSFLRERGGEM